MRWLQFDTIRIRRITKWSDMTKFRLDKTKNGDENTRNSTSGPSACTVYQAVIWLSSFRYRKGKEKYQILNKHICLLPTDTNGRPGRRKRGFHSLILISWLPPQANTCMLCDCRALFQMGKDVVRKASKNRQHYGGEMRVV